MHFFNAVDFQSQAASSNEVFLMPPWSANSTLSSELFSLNSGWASVKRRIRSNDKSATNSEVFTTPEGLQSTMASRIASRTLYQKRKHVWRSRRPVQCPNCQKIITMAYNLKSHLSTCLKRNGGLYRRT